MRFTIDKEQFLKGLLIASHGIGAKSVLPELLCFKLELTDAGLDIEASGSDLTIWTLVPSKINGTEIIRNAQPGATLISAHVLTEVIRKMDGKEISLEVIDDRIAKIEDGTASFKLNCISAGEYPDISNDKNGVALVMPCAELAKLCEQTAFAAFEKDTRPILTAINLSAQGGTLTAIATNSARLSRKEVSIDASSPTSRPNRSWRSPASSRGPRKSRSWWLQRKFSSPLEPPSFPAAYSRTITR